MTNSSEASGQPAVPDVTGELLVASYAAGRLLNHIEWLHLQEMACQQWFARTQIEELLNRLVENGTRLATDSAAKEEIKFQRKACLDLLTVLHDGREGAGWGYLKKYRKVRREFEQAVRIPSGNKFDKALDVVSKEAKCTLAVLRRAVEAGAKRTPLLDDAFQLGRCVDEGVHPPGAYRHVFRLVPVDEADVPDAAVPSVPTSRDDTSRLAAPATGPKLKLVARPHEPGALPPPHGWATELRKLWVEFLRLPVDLPAEFQDFKRGIKIPTKDVVEAVDRAARQALYGMGKPRWDPATRKLFLGSQEVGCFTAKAENLKKVLDAFQEEGWPPRIDDPLERSNYGERRHDTVRDLNEKVSLIKFASDDCGIRWELRGQAVHPGDTQSAGMRPSKPSKRRSR
jgi:hypothetical protein